MLVKILPVKVTRRMSIGALKISHFNLPYGLPFSPRKGTDTTSRGGCAFTDTAMLVDGGALILLLQVGVLDLGVLLVELQTAVTFQPLQVDRSPEAYADAVHDESRDDVYLVEG